MAVLYQFKEHLRHRVLGTQSSAAELFLNYLEGFYPQNNLDFAPRIVEEFHLWTLNDVHLRLNCKYLSHLVLDEIQPFFRKHHLTAEFAALKEKIPAQVVHIENFNHFLSALEAHYQKENSNSIRVMPFKDQTALVLQLKFDGRLQVFSHCAMFALWEGRLRPLPALSSLYYDSSFELEKLQLQRIFYPPSEMMHFQIDNTGVEITDFTPSKMFKYTKVHLQNLSDHKKLFHHLKTMENYYIQAKSDPYYQKLIQSLQASWQMLISQHPAAVDHACRGLKQAHHALKSFYSNDRLLILLSSNIEYWLRHKAYISSAILTGGMKNDPFIQKLLKTPRTADSLNP